VLEGNRNVYWQPTAIENLVYFGVLKGLTRAQARSRGDDLLDFLGLAAKRAETVQKLSRGMQQKLAIACALVHAPALLLLDEPTLGLDVEAAETVKERVRHIAREQGTAVLLTTHQMDVAEEISDRVAFIRGGEIILEDRTRNLLQAFSLRSYTFVSTQPLGADRVEHLSRLGASVEQNDSGAVVRLHSPDPAAFYAVVDILKPLDLDDVRRDTADLLEVFKRVVHKGEGAR
jgi:ABC-2 type transport system ATP-binding protein